MAKKFYMQEPDGRIIETECPQYYTEATQLPFKKGKVVYKEQVANRLRERVRPGMSIWYLVTHVARSGMSRRIRFYIIEDGAPICISYDIATVLDWSFHRDDRAVIVQGWGMDMAFHTVETLSRSLWPDLPNSGYLLRQRAM